MFMFNYLSGDMTLPASIFLDILTMPKRCIVYMFLRENKFGC